MKLTEAQAKEITTLQNEFDPLIEKISKWAESPEKALCVKNLKQARLWAIEHVKEYP